jgi:peptide deformylase
MALPMKNLSLVTGSLATIQLPSIALRQISQPVPHDVSLQMLRQLIEEMFTCLYMTNGVGLAAPQVGVLWRLFIVDTRDPSLEQPLVLINPRFLDMSEEIEEGREGCLSIPGYVSFRVPRSKTVKLEAFDHRLEPITLEVNDYLARVFQHEYDHLDGILYIDRLKSLDEVEENPDIALNKAKAVTSRLYHLAEEGEVVRAM